MHKKNVASFFNESKEFVGSSKVKWGYTTNVMTVAGALILDFRWSYSHSHLIETEQRMIQSLEC